MTRPCPRCGHVGPVVGAAPVWPHVPEAMEGPWHYCAAERCEVVFHLDEQTITVDTVRTRVGAKAVNKESPVCFCFAHTAEDLRDDLETHGGVGTIKTTIKAAVAEGLCACEHLNPSGQCCLADVHRTLKTLTAPSPA
jgi:hypothetical protein